jgi:hypothetical protein
MLDIFNTLFSGLFKPLEDGINKAATDAGAATGAATTEGPPDVQGILFRAGFGALWQDEWRFAETPGDLVRMGGPEIDFHPKKPAPPTTTSGFARGEVGRDQEAAVSVAPSTGGATDIPTTMYPDGPGDPSIDLQEAPTPLSTDGSLNRFPPNNAVTTLPKVNENLPALVREGLTPRPPVRWTGDSGMAGRAIDPKVRKERLFPYHPNAWTKTNPTWRQLEDHQRAAAMALMEADGMDINDARNALAAMHNRANKDGLKLGEHVSTRAYQPTFEPAQERRLGAIIKSKQFQELVAWSQRYSAGQEKDPVQGATHFLAKPGVMLALEAREPNKYRSWRSWTGFDQTSGTYKNQTITDKSHAFLAPMGRWTLEVERSQPADSIPVTSDNKPSYPEWAKQWWAKHGPKRED